MTAPEVILIVIVVILILYIAKCRTHEHRSEKRYECVDKDTGDTMSVKIHGSACKCPKCSDPEKNAISEHAEYFTVCGDSTDVQKELSCYCSDSTGQFAENAYGGPGQDYHDYVMSQGIDGQVVKNHAEFVQDRAQGGSVNWTGRTYAMPDEVESEFYPNAWQGIRGRPQAVPVCNPTQVTDPSAVAFSDKPKLVWSST